MTHTRAVRHMNPLQRYHYCARNGLWADARRYAWALYVPADRWN